MTNKITFKDNPWKAGHRILNFIWSGHINEDGLWFDFHLESADYDEENNELDSQDDEEVSDWQAKIVWNNYHNCTLSSTYWGEASGFQVGKELNQFDIRKLGSKVYDVDPLSKYDFDNPSFNIYLLGHDSVAEHRIHFSENELNKFDIKWEGKIALTYAGQNEFLHSFEANLLNVSFQGFDIPEEVPDKRALELLEIFTVESEIYTISKVNGQRKIIIN
ncbi:hypothetical protein GC098_02360 [Paenibacillus sp. LMG 31458]|uniref:Uncharacterized protein n=1 Tax=Paenibacillus phytorum TaxID=2654977 RepID=A0ABX1XP31_9BACL|nr:hypothetical protein [Paenibacillus phytorum]NOU70290.1 hypothetical protein [Paenibacillus phytorum]